MPKHYGCEKKQFDQERFACDYPTCGYKMEDGKCGRLSQEEIRIEPAPVKAKKTRGQDDKR